MNVISRSSKGSFMCTSPTNSSVLTILPCPFSKDLLQFLYPVQGVNILNVNMLCMNKRVLKVKTLFWDAPGEGGRPLWMGEDIADLDSKVLGGSKGRSGYIFDAGALKLQIREKIIKLDNNRRP